MSQQKILVLENDDGLRKLAVSALTSGGYECIQAVNGVEALALLDSSAEFELVLSSLTIPRLDSLRLLECVRSKHPNTQVVVMVLSSDVTTALLAVRNGAYDYILKPFDPEDLLTAVGRALENRRLKLENSAYETNLEMLVTGRTEQLRQAISTLERSYDVTLEALGNALDLKDAEPESHSKRVTAFTIGLARAMGLSTEEIRIIARGAFLHDIGKMAIPDAILRKPGALDLGETAIMREHSFRGYQIVQRIPFLAEPAKIVHCHHENYDGTGYPRGLTGDQIPLGGRIVAIANTLDAMTSHRPYQEARSLGVARAEIQRWSGRQFDPQIVKVFLQMPETIWPKLRNPIARPQQ
jgi:putative nucleotidyltransferase with HDIG domain